MIKFYYPLINHILYKNSGYNAKKRMHDISHKPHMSNILKQTLF